MVSVVVAVLSFIVTVRILRLDIMKKKHPLALYISKFTVILFDYKIMNVFAFQAILVVQVSLNHQYPMNTWKYI